MISVLKHRIKMEDPNHKVCSQEHKNLVKKHFYIQILRNISFFFKTKKWILHTIKYGCQIKHKMKVLSKWERKQQGFYSRQEPAKISFNSVPENNNRIKIIFSIKFLGKWKKYLGIHKLDK